MQTFSDGHIPAGITHSDLSRRFRQSKGGRSDGLDVDAAEVSAALQSLSEKRPGVVQRAAVLLLVGTVPSPGKAAAAPASAEEGAGGDAVKSPKASRRAPLVKREWVSALRAGGTAAEGREGRPAAEVPVGTAVPEVVVAGSALDAGRAPSLAQDAQLLTRLLLAFDTNNFAATGDDLSPHSDAVCPLLAALNHSCSPNCAVEWTILRSPAQASAGSGGAGVVSAGDRGEGKASGDGASDGEGGSGAKLTRSRLAGVMRAIRPIARGEAVTHSFCDPTDDVVSRADRLSNLHGFACACARCAKGVAAAACLDMATVHGWQGLQTQAV